MLADSGKEERRARLRDGCEMQNRDLKSSGGSWGAVECSWIASTRSSSSGKGGDGGMVTVFGKKSSPPSVSFGRSQRWQEVAVSGVRGLGSRVSKCGYRSRTTKLTVAGLQAVS